LIRAKPFRMATEVPDESFVAKDEVVFGVEEFNLL
jgi:hypothetical protein